MNLYAAGPNWRATFDRLAPDLVWLPPSAPWPTDCRQKAGTS